MNKRTVKPTGKVNVIKTWNERCETHPDHQTGMVSNLMIQARMQEEIDELRAALAEPVQEPVAWMYPDDYEGILKNQSYTKVFQKEWCNPAVCVPLYTAPPQRKPLTDEEIGAAANSVRWSQQYHVDFTRAIERAHGIET